MGGRRIPASRQTSERIDELLNGRTGGDVRTELIRLGVRKLIEDVLEAEVEDQLGRGYYGAAMSTPVATVTAIAGGISRVPRGRSSIACRSWRTWANRTARACGRS